MEDEQRVIITFLTRESIDAQEIHTRLSAQFLEQTYALGTIQFCVREIQRGRENLYDVHRFGRPAFDDINTKTVLILETVPFESVRSIAQVLNANHATVLRRLHKKLGFKSYCL
jgi:hypothetical protein